MSNAYLCCLNQVIVQHKVEKIAVLYLTKFCYLDKKALLPKYQQIVSYSEARSSDQLLP